MAEKIRLSLDVTPEMKAIIEGLAESSGQSQAEVLRKAVGLLKAAKDAEPRGLDVALVDKEGKLDTRLVGV